MVSEELKFEGSYSKAKLWVKEVASENSEEIILQCISTIVQLEHYGINRYGGL